MTGLSYLFLYIPICLVILVVLEACRTDEPSKVARRVLANFSVLTIVLVVGSALVYIINRYL